MNAGEYLSRIPVELHTEPWLQPIVDFLKEQARVIQEQTRVISKLRKSQFRTYMTNSRRCIPFAEYREEMLKALDHPGLPLHNNDGERDIRGVAKRRHISGTIKSGEGKAFRDGLRYREAGVLC